MTAKTKGRPKGSTNKAAAKTVKTPKVAKTPKLKVIEPVIEDAPLDTSIVIDDFVTLRAKVRTAMGDYAKEAKPDIVALIKAKKSSSSQIHYVHPLSLNVLTGAERINPREFANDEMRIRQIQFGNALVSEGINKPLVAFVKGDELALIGGETRLRSVLHAYLRGLVPDPKNSKVGLLPVLLEKHGTSDFDRALRVVTDNDQRPLTHIEIAEKIKDMKELGEARGMTKMEVMQRIAEAFGRTVTFVYSHLGYMELPSEVIGLLRREPIAVSLAMSAWKKAKQNTPETMKILTAALARSKAQGAKKAMPKHTPELAVVPTDTGANDDVVTEGTTTEVETTIKPDRKATESAVIKATETILDAIRDARWVMTNDGFVKMDTTPGAPAVEWSVEDFMAFTKVLGGFHLPNDPLFQEETVTA